MSSFRATNADANADEEVDTVLTRFLTRRANLSPVPVTQTTRTAHDVANKSSTAAIEHAQASPTASHQAPSASSTASTASQSPSAAAPMSYEQLFVNAQTVNLRMHHEELTKVWEWRQRDVRWTPQSATFAQLLNDEIQRDDKAAQAQATSVISWYNRLQQITTVPTSHITKELMLKGATVPGDPLTAPSMLKVCERPDFSFLDVVVPMGNIGENVHAAVAAPTVSIAATMTSAKTPSASPPTDAPVPLADANTNTRALQAIPLDTASTSPPLLSLPPKRTSLVLFDLPPPAISTASPLHQAHKLNHLARKTDQPNELAQIIQLNLPYTTQISSLHAFQSHLPEMTPKAHLSSTPSAHEASTAIAVTSSTKSATSTTATAKRKPIKATSDSAPVPEKKSHKSKGPYPENRKTLKEMQTPSLSQPNPSTKKTVQKVTAAVSPPIPPQTTMVKHAGGQDVEEEPATQRVNDTDIDTDDNSMLFLPELPRAIPNESEPTSSSISFDAAHEDEGVTGAMLPPENDETNNLHFNELSLDVLDGPLPQVHATVDNEDAPDLGFDDSFFADLDANLDVYDPQANDKDLPASNPTSMSSAVSLPVPAPITTTITAPIISNGSVKVKKPPKTIRFGTNVVAATSHSAIIPNTSSNARIIKSAYKSTLHRLEIKLEALLTGLDKKTAVHGLPESRRAAHGRLPYAAHATTVTGATAGGGGGATNVSTLDAFWQVGFLSTRLNAWFSSGLLDAYPSIYHLVMPGKLAVQPLAFIKDEIATDNEMITMQTSATNLVSNLLDFRVLREAKGVPTVDASVQVTMSRVCISSTAEWVCQGWTDGCLTVSRVDQQNALLSASMVLSNGHASMITACSFSPSQTHIVSAALTGGGMCLWDLRRTDVSSKLVARYPDVHLDPIWDVQFCSRNTYMVSSSMDKVAILWRTDCIVPLRYFLEADASIERSLFHPGHRYIVSGCADGRIYLWSTQTSRAVRLLETLHHTTAIASMALQSEGRYLASIDADGNACVWNLALAKVVQTVTFPVSMHAGSRSSPVAATSASAASSAQSYFIQWTHYDSVIMMSDGAGRCFAWHFIESGNGVKGKGIAVTNGRLLTEAYSSANMLCVCTRMLEKNILCMLACPL